MTILVATILWETDTQTQSYVMKAQNTVKTNIGDPTDTATNFKMTTASGISSDQFLISTVSEPTKMYQ